MFVSARWPATRLGLVSALGREAARRSAGVLREHVPETTFYVLAVYFGAVGIRHARHAVGCALLADVAGVIAASRVCYWFFG